MIWRLRLMGRVGWLILLGCAVALLALAGGVYAFTRDGGGGRAAPETTTSAVTPPASADIFYLRALAPDTRARGCKMTIRFRWKPHYHALQYVGETAVIEATGPGIEGTYRRAFSRKGVTFVPAPVPLAGGYQIWSARIVTLGGHKPGNDTKIQAAPPSSSNCD